MKRVFFSVLLFLSLLSSSQTVIKGNVYDSGKKPLPNANIIISDSNLSIICFAISNEDGSYRLSFSSKRSELSAEVSYIGYKKTTKVLSNKNQTINFILKESFEELKEVFVKSKPIRKIGDTLSYSVPLFRDRKDRVIADVLKKMPGIDVLPNGSILYQGVPIQKYYINGMDLLEGRYNLANNNLPVNSVSNVQILENHQPIKVLDSILFSTKTSLNIKLKNNIAVTGFTKTGLGVSPLLWNINLTPMIFSKNKQIISSYQTNNVGKTVGDDLKYLTMDDLLDRIEHTNISTNWINIKEARHPDFQKSRWLNNNVNLLSSNYLQRFQKDIDLKINLSYIEDTQTQKSKTKTIFTIPGNSIHLLENVQNTEHLKTLKSELILERNSKKSFLKNTLQYNHKWDLKKGIVNSNNRIKQYVKTPDGLVENKLKWIFPVGKNLFTFKSNFSYRNSFQKLHIHSYNEQVLNNEYLYSDIEQDLLFRNYYTDNSINFIKKVKHFSFATKIGFRSYYQKLNTKLLTINDESQTYLPNEYANKLTFRENNVYSEIKTQFIRNKWKLMLKLPLKLLQHSVDDVSLYRKVKKKRIHFEPTMMISNDINSLWKTSVLARINTKYGTIKHLHYGYILVNYRTLNKYDNSILEKNNKALIWKLAYRNPIESLFFSFDYSLKWQKHSLMNALLVDELGNSFYGFYDKENRMNSHVFSANISKYYSHFKTNLSIRSSVSTSESNQLVNDNVEKVKSNTIYFETKINSKVAKWISTDLHLKLSFNENLSNSFDNESFNHSLSFDLNIFPSTTHFFSLNTDYYQTNSQMSSSDDYFINLKYRYTFNKRKIDLELEWNNILNTKQAINYSNNSYLQIQNIYYLRPSQIVVSGKFSLERLFNK